MDISYLNTTVVVFLLFIFATVVFLAKLYRRCPSNKILVVYGRVGGNKTVQCYHGGGTFVWPLIQGYAFLDLTPRTIHIPLKGALSHQNIRVNVPSTFTVAVGITPEIMNNAAVRLLDLDHKGIEIDGHRDHHRPAAPDCRLPPDRRDQPRPRTVPRVDQKEHRTRAAQNRPHPFERQHHRHHR